ncbi:CAP-associated domain-containing protein [Sporosarcina sp. GW1-11]|uniref:CAP domain-containing protein n=1 Tax=Sporosarcina sp. GW1-11 TaxID=2899126 RepID=UPI00294C8ED9|nr:CAP-associated domain-containing protein [Sporosarcina sp. GW1-11]MDV6376826.1 CAP-associated domain-containing protein [Sporosarcina sp. GW1-11]
MNDNVSENKPLESPVQHGVPIAVPEKGQSIGGEGMPRPEEGMSIYVGQKAQQLEEAFGKPTRIEPSSFQYEWWVYTEKPRFMAGVLKGKVNQIYTADKQADVSPFTIHQGVEEIHRFTPIESEIDVAIKENIYTFSLNSEDINNRLLIPYQNLYVQLYIDQVEGQLEGVRFISPSTLVKHQPYDMAYLGEMIEAPKPSSTVQTEVDRSMERQTFELTNQLREEHNAPLVINDEKLATLSWEHSQEMIFQKYSSHTAPSIEIFAERLKLAEIPNTKAAENTAFNYIDAIETVHGWLNSPKHREVLLNPSFTHMGVGVYNKYYTQSFITQNKTIEIIEED